MRLQSGTYLVLLCAVLLAGCFESGEKVDSRNQANGDKEGESDPLIVEWSPPTDSNDAVYLFKVSAAAETECNVTTQREGNSNDSESRLLSYSMLFNNSLEDTSIRSVIHSSGLAVHAREVHTKTFDQMLRDLVLDEIVTAEWRNKSGWTPFSNGTRGGLAAGFGLQFDEGVLPTVSVECDSKDALVQIYQADSFAPIYSSTSEGGIGFHSPIPGNAGIGGIGVNEGDTYTISTEGDLVVLDLLEFPGSFAGVDPFVDGTIQIRDPGGEETVTYELGDEEFPWGYQKIWREPGTYEIELDRHAVGFEPLKGIFAGFVVVEEFGALEVTE